MNTKSLIVAAVAIAAASAVPAAARTAAPATAAPVAGTEPSSTQRICVVDNFTGSRLPTKVCRTRAEWTKLGLDPLAK
ncbi:hypothetical protein ACM61V_13385 [Sphingomonas sp. TX0543]|uniref:hypothetical protein n=1 Tax=unclassified Sphingomonas TaxID=196159 RepID=UPI0010F6A4EB|nr:hypothetical protein [Sphingomonas sp. 3P27F8]